MRAFFYLGTFVFGFLGVMNCARALETVATGHEMPVTSILLGIIFLLVALASLYRARAASNDQS
jgi:uncharacterized membrane protein